MGRAACRLTPLPLTLTLTPTFWQAHANLANALQQLGAADLALMYYASALRLRPRFTDALANMASAYLQKGAVVQVSERGMPVRRQQCADTLTGGQG